MVIFRAGPPVSLHEGRNTTRLKTEQSLEGFVWSRQSITGLIFQRQFALAWNANVLQVGRLEDVLS